MRTHGVGPLSGPSDMSGGRTGLSIYWPLTSSVTLTLVAVDDGAAGYPKDVLATGPVAVDDATNCRRRSLPCRRGCKRSLLSPKSNVMESIVCFQRVREVQRMIDSFSSSRIISCTLKRKLSLYGEEVWLYVRTYVDHAPHPHCNPHARL